MDFVTCIIVCLAVLILGPVLLPVFLCLAPLLGMAILLWLATHGG